MPPRRSRSPAGKAKPRGKAKTGGKAKGKSKNWFQALQEEDHAQWERYQAQGEPGEIGKDKGKDKGEIGKDKGKSFECVGKCNAKGKSAHRYSSMMMQQ